VCYETR